MSKLTRRERGKLTYEEIVAKLKELSVDTTDVESVDTYVFGHTLAPFDMWLKANMPSKVREGEDIFEFVGVVKKSARVGVKSKSATDGEEKISSIDGDKTNFATDGDEKKSATYGDEKNSLPDGDEKNFPPHVMEMKTKFSKEIFSGKEITKQLIFDLAVEFGITAGKWMIHVPTGVKVDELWTKIAWAIFYGSLPGCSYAKVSTMTDGKMQGNNNPSHVVCIYNDNFLDMDDVRALESGIRAIGIRGKLSYKPDIFTYCGVNRHNQWKINPVIYQSNYDVKSKQSKIDVF